MKMNPIAAATILFVSPCVADERATFDFVQTKTVDKNAGAWRSEDFKNLKFFFEDGTALYVSFGHTAIGKWKFLDQRNGSIAYDWRVNGKVAEWTARIENDKLVEDLGDYTNTYFRLPTDRGSSPKNAQQGGADQPATAPESKPEGNKKPKPEAEARPK